MKANGLLRTIATVALLGACVVNPTLRTKTAELDTPNGLGLNGLGLNGLGLNGLGLNGLGLNGVSLNGVSLNGLGLNGLGLNGLGLNGLGLNGLGLNGVSLNGLGLNGVGLFGVLSDGSLIGDYDFIGATFEGNLSDGSTIPLQIDNIEIGQAPSDDLYLYYVSYQNADGWQPLCGTDEDGNAIAAVPLNGVWNYAEGVEGGGSHTDTDTQFTFACTHTALGKCVTMMGYKPWKTAPQCDGNGNCTNVSLAPYHQACTRMVRADYCGNGKPWTIDGRIINLYDGLGIQTDTESFQFEAEWTTEGASCVVSTRIEWPTYDQCVVDRMVDASSGCGNSANFSNGTLIMEEYQTRGTAP